MAELAVLGASLNLVEIVFHLDRKLNPWKHVQKEITSMEKWLKSIKDFIEINDGRDCGRKQQLVTAIRGTAYDIEDVLDEIILHTPPYIFHNHRISRKVHKVAHSVYHGFPVRGISDKIAAIQRCMDVIKSQRNIFASSSSHLGASTSGSPSRASYRVSPHLLDHKMVGYEKLKKEFIHRLMDGEPSLVTLAVEGPHGSGKTTFVGDVYRKEGILGEFDCHAWVDVSRDIDVEKLSNDMLSQFCDLDKKPYPYTDSLNAMSKVRKYLTGKKFLVVLDDIWKKEDWDNIKDAFPDSISGSRIIFTTSFANVATICASYPHHICSLKDGLEPYDGWNLFCRKAFPDSNGECPSELKDISQRILKRCEGLPLTIVAVGDALANIHRRPNAWESFHDSLGCPLGRNSKLSGISNVLLPAYMDLSSHLKSCFLYLSIFPEDYSFGRGRLIRLWVAEGFVEKRECMTAEEVAEDYFCDLINRNLVHVSDKDFDGRPRNCRVRNLVLQFITQKCKEENFGSIYSRETTSDDSERIRRLSLHNDFSHLPKNCNLSGVRSMFLLRSLDISPSDFEKHFHGFKLLRVLDLQDARLTEFPKAIIHLALLRYLSLRATKINDIPSSIKKLSYLETLDLKQTKVTELPNEISQLHKLRHLFAYKKDERTFILFDSVQGVKISSEGLSNLTNLQNLSTVKVDQKGQILKELQELSQLRKLRLMGIKEEHGKDLCASIQQMQMLRTLDLCSLTKEECLELGEMENPPRTLERLYLKGRLKEFPRKISSLHNLLRIGLKWSKLEKSPLEALKWLPNLIELQLVDSYVGEELIFEASGFKKLKILRIEDFSELQTVEIKKGALPNLEKISLGRCPKLKKLPLGIETLAKIKEMVLHDMSEEFIGRVGKNGEDHANVEHIPLVHFQKIKSWSI